MRHIPRIAGAIATVCVSAFASAAGVQPIKSEGSAARAVLSSTFLQYETQEYDNTFAQSSRDIVYRALQQIGAATTYAGLAAAPDGVTVNCQESGTLTARVTNPLLRTVHFEWNQCLRNDFDMHYGFDGPGDVTLLSATLTPTFVPSIRFGDRNRDLVETITPGPTLPTGFYSSTDSRNLRLTGVLPMVHSDVFTSFPGRYTLEVVGYVRSVQHIPEFDAPDGPRYDYDILVSTDGALITYEVTGNSSSFNQDFRMVLGTVSETEVSPITPSRPQPITASKSVRGTDLRVQIGLNGGLSQWEQSIDGRADVDFNQWWGFNCSSPETFVYRTKSPMAYPSQAYMPTLNTGELNINGNTTVKFTSTGTEPYVDLVGHIATQVGGVGNFNYDYAGYAIFSSPELYNAAICSH